MTGQGTDPAAAPHPWSTQDIPEVPDAYPDAYPDPGAQRRGRRRRRRQSITFGVFFLLVAGIGALMLAAYQGRVTLPIGDGKPPPLPTCGPAPSPTAQPFAETSVHVYNASSRKGLALSVARDLQRRGFRVPTTPANDPQRAKVTTLAVIRHGAKGVLSAHTLAGVVAGPVTYQLDDRLGTDVDLVLGQTFALTTTPSGSAAKPSAAGGTAAAAAAPTCQPAAGSATP